MTARRWAEAAERCEQELQADPTNAALRHRAAVNWLLAAIVLSPPDRQVPPTSAAAQLLDRALAHVSEEDEIRQHRFKAEWNQGYYMFRDALLRLAVRAAPGDRLLAQAVAFAYPDERPVPYDGLDSPPYSYLRQLAKAHPDIALLQYLGGYAAVLEGDTTEGEAMLVQADASLQGDRRARLALVQLYDEQGRFADARRLLALAAGSGPGSEALHQWERLYREAAPDGAPVRVQPAGDDLALTPEAPRQFVLAMAWAPDSRILTLINFTKLWVVDTDTLAKVEERPRQAGSPEPGVPAPVALPDMAAAHWGRSRLCSESGDLVACVYYPWAGNGQPRLRIFNRRTGGRADYVTDLTVQTSYALRSDADPQAVALSPDGKKAALLLEDSAHEATVLRILRLDP